jgi:hypothetical protein
VSKPVPKTNIYVIDIEVGPIKMAVIVKADTWDFANESAKQRVVDLLNKLSDIKPKLTKTRWP